MMMPGGIHLLIFSCIMSVFHNYIQMCIMINMLVQKLCMYRKRRLIQCDCPQEACS